MFMIKCIEKNYRHLFPYFKNYDLINSVKLSVKIKLLKNLFYFVRFTG